MFVKSGINQIRSGYILLRNISLQHALQLKVEGSHLSCKTIKKCQHVCEHVEVVDWNKDVHPIHSLAVNH